MCLLFDWKFDIYIYICYHVNNVPSRLSPQCHHNGFVASHALGHMMQMMHMIYIYFYFHLASVRSEHSVSHGSLKTPYDHLWQLLYIYIYIYIYIDIHTHIKKTNFIVCDCCEHQKITYFSIQIYFRTVFLHQCMSVHVWKIHVENLVFTTNLQ